MTLSNDLDRAAIEAYEKIDEEAEAEAKKFNGFEHLDEWVQPKQLRELTALLTKVHPGLTLDVFEENFVAKQTDLRVKWNNIKIEPIIEAIQDVAKLIKNGSINPYNKLAFFDFFGKDILPNETNANRMRRLDHLSEKLSQDLQDFDHNSFRRLASDLSGSHSGNDRAEEKQRIQALILAGMTLTSAIRQLPPDQLGAKTVLDGQAPNVDGLKDAHRAIGRLLGLIGVDLSHAGETAQLIDRISDTLEARANAFPKLSTPKGP